MVQLLDLLESRHEARDVRRARVVQVDVLPGISGDVEEARSLGASHAAALLATEVGLRRVRGEHTEPASARLGADDQLQIATAQRAKGAVPVRFGAIALQLVTESKSEMYLETRICIGSRNDEYGSQTVVRAYFERPSAEHRCA